MDTATFHSLLKTAVITGVTLFRPAAEANWEIHVQGDALPADLAIELDGGGGRRSWTDLTAAHAWIRKHGYRGPIRIEEAHAA